MLCWITAIALSATAAEAQTPVKGDTLEAMALAREAASEPVVGGYFLAGLVVGPTAALSIALVMGGERPQPWMAAGPVALLVLGSAASRSNVPPSDLAALTSGADSAYSAVFERTYDETLQRRRRTATAAGGIAGILGTILLLVFGLDTYT